MICKESSIVFPDWNDSDSNSCVVAYCMNIMDMARKESCGKCVLCREGTRQVYEIIKDITEGKAESNDYKLLMDILGQIKLYAGCEMSRKVASICIELMTRYEEEWDQHIRRQRCSKLVCIGSYTLYIDPQLCNGCGKCMESCPPGAIVGGDKMIHVIDTQKCKKSMVCVSVCPQGAIKKAGPVKPKIPEEPVPVGSFSENSSGRRRRRRRK